MTRQSTIIVCWFALAASPLGADPAVGTPVSPSLLFPDPRAVSHGNGWAIPLSGARPKWYTVDLSRRVIEAEGLPVAAPAGAPLAAEVGIRPGAWMVEPHGCTMNFVFT